MTDNDIVRRGYLNVVQKLKGGVISRVLSVTSRRYWVVLRRGSGSHGGRVELYRSEDQSNDPVRTIMLSSSSLQGVETLERKKAFVLALHDESVMFQCSSRAEMDDWHSDLRYYSGGSSKRPEDRGGRTPSAHAPAATGEIYEIIPDDETYRVRLRKAKSLSFQGACLLEILRDFEHNLFHIGLFTEDNKPQLIVKWQIDHVRQYGSNNQTFKFESGTKSPTGVDWFILDTEPGYAVKIHRVVDYWAKHIVEQVKNIPSGSSARSVPRRSTLPSNNSVPDNSRPSSQAQRNSTSMASPGGGGGSSLYMPLQPGTMSPGSVYATPDPAVPSKSNTGPRSKKPAPPPAGANSTYMALDVNSMNPTGNQTYEGIPPRSALPPRPNGNSSQSQGQNPNQQLYMGIDPRTKNVAEGGHYMGLNEARSN